MFFLFVCLFVCLFFTFILVLWRSPRPKSFVRANCFRAFLLLTRFTRHVMHRARALSGKWTIIGQMATATTLRGFNDLGRSVTPIFLLMGHFLYRFSTFCEKRKKIYWVEVWISCKTHHQIPFIWPLRLAVRRFQMPLEGLRFVKMMEIFGIIKATDSLIQNIIRIVCHCWLIFDILT